MKKKKKPAKPKPIEETKDTPTTLENAAFGGLAQDQRKRGYYYDDSHGYQKYVPESEETEDEESSGRDD